MEMVGRVRKVVSSKGYGFILTDAEKQYFFHIANTKDRKMPNVGAVVRFRAVPQEIEGKKDRAVEVEAA